MAQPEATQETSLEWFVGIWANTFKQEQDKSRQDKSRRDK